MCASHVYPTMCMHIPCVQLGMDARINVYDLFTELRKAGDLKVLGLKAVQMEEHGKRYSCGYRCMNDVPFLCF